MAKRYIGIELDGAVARVALLSDEGGPLSLVLRKQDYASTAEAREILAALTEGAGSLGDHLVTALPARAGFFRRLEFPFKDRSKLEAVLPSELDAQVPVSLDQYLCAMQVPRDAGEHYSVPAAAASRETIETLLEHFPEPAQQPRRIDLLPHGLAAGLGEQDGLLAYCGRNETLVALVLGGRIAEYRLLPGGEGIETEEAGPFVISRLRYLEQIADREDLPFWACGSMVTEGLLNAWQRAGRTPIVPVLPLEQDVSFEFLPAVLLALAEKGTNRQNGFNFRIGPFAPQGQLEMLKKKLIAAAVLALFCLMIWGGTGYFEYHRKSRQADALDQQLEDLFRQTMPDAKVIVDAPMQMRSHLKELRQQAVMLGVGGQVTTLDSLEALSSMIDPDLKNDIEEMSYNGDQIRLDGYTESFDAVNRITQALSRSPLISFVEISEAKMAADGGRVDFQLQIDLIDAEGAQ